MEQTNAPDASADAALAADLPISHAKFPAKARKTEVVSFRLSPEAHAKLMSRAAESGLSSRAWMEQAILENRSEIVAVAKPHSELKPLVFQANKAGNNLNQLAHHFNALNMRGKLSASHCEEALYLLALIQASFREAVANARPS
ncbi:plasmid mobilization protein [Variovorax sp. LT1P1]|uniref:plasmid mobilization protein n=1 Tax=Variovorax sp. LT1P1 TaxID=3443730 RepID=UPI003F486F79